MTYHIYIITKNHRALRRQLLQNFSEELQLLGSLDDEHPFEIVSSRRLNANETQYLLTCPNVVGFYERIETPCTGCGTTIEVEFNEQGEAVRPGLCDKCYAHRMFNFGKIVLKDR